MTLEGVILLAGKPDPITQTGLVPEMPELGVVHKFSFTEEAAEEEHGISNMQRTADTTIPLAKTLLFRRLTACDKSNPINPSASSPTVFGSGTAAPEAEDA